MISCLKWCSNLTFLTHDRIHFVSIHIEQHFEIEEECLMVDMVVGEKKKIELKH